MPGHVGSLADPSQATLSKARPCLQGLPEKRFAQLPVHGHAYRSVGTRPPDPL